MAFHFIVRLEPKPGSEESCRQALRKVMVPTRAEPGCLAIEYFETLREPTIFAIHSEWTDETAFELHAGLPHTLEFLATAEQLLTHPVEGLRLRPLAGS